MGSGPARAVGEALAAAAGEFSRVARGVPDPDCRVPATPEWTAADVVAHVAIEADRYRRELEGDSDWSGSVPEIAATNRRALASHAERDIGRSLAWMTDSVERYVGLLAGRDPEAASHHLDGGLLMLPRQAAGLLLGELLVHGRDLAAAEAPRLEITAGDAVLIIDGALHTLPVMVDKDAARGHVGIYEIRVRGHGRYTIRVDDGTVWVSAGGVGRRDAVLSVDPVAFLLVSYGRMGPVAAALRGRVLAWGRRPHRALALDRIFHRI